MPPAPHSADRASQWIPALLAVLAPCFLFPTPARLVAALILLGVWFGATRPSGLIPDTPLTRPLCALLVLVLLSCWTTFDIRFSLGKVAGVTYGVVVFWGIVRWTRQSASWQISMWYMAAAGGVLGAVGLFGTAWATKAPWTPIFTEALPGWIRGIPGAESGFNPNALAGTLILFVPLQWALALKKELTPWTRLSVVGLAVFATGVVLLAQSRAGVLGLIVASLAFSAVRVSPGPRFHHRRWLFGLASFGVVVILIAFVWITWESATSMMRRAVWQRALTALSDVPITGMGLGTFRRVMPEFYPILDLPVEEDIAHAHNQFLQTALDLGLPGLIVYLLILLRTFQAVRANLWGRPAAERNALLGLGAGLLAHLMFGLVDAVPLGAKAGLAFWVLLALVFAAPTATSADSRLSRS